MSTTLTNGLKLPDKGSVDWYADMQNNYTILNGAVGTIAEHTSALSGKAPLVHTHSKSDVTDLFNSANTWSGDNTYSASINYKSSYTLGNLPASAIAQSAFKILDSTGTDFICDINSFQNALATGLRFTTRNKMDANGFSPSGTIKANYLHFLQNAENKGYLQWDGYTKNNVIPLTTNTYDLGTSSYQWNNLYAKNYYYNGTAWGLDKANVWTANNTFLNSIVYFKLGSSDSYNDIRWKDNNDSHYATLRSRVTDLTLGLQYSSASAWYSGASVVIRNDGNVQIKSYDGTENWTVNFTPVGVYPTSDKSLELGTSTHKWKTLNGINPGALSLPKTDSTITSIGTSGFSFDGTSERIPDTINIFSNGEALMNGWLCARIAEGAGHYIFLTSDDTTGRYGICSSCFSTGIVSTLSFGISVYVPIKAGDKPAIRWAKPNGGNAQLVFYHCLGNV